MDPALRRAVARRLAETRSAPVEVAGAAPVGGGSIHSAWRVDLAGGGGRVFVKASRNTPAEMFEREAAGLAALRAPGALRVPGDPLPGAGGGFSFLVLEVRGGPRAAGGTRLRCAGSPSGKSLIGRTLAPAGPGGQSVRGGHEVSR